MAERAPFSFDAPFVARGELLHDGVTYGDGQPFAWRDLGVSEYQVWNLWQYGRVDVAPAKASRPDPVAPPPPADAPDAEADAPVEFETETSKVKPTPPRSIKRR